MDNIRHLSGIGTPVTFYPKLKKITGSTNAAILLCYLAFWHGKGKDKSGWFYKNSSDIERETSLTIGEQRSARKLLVSKGFISEARHGLPPVIYFYVNFDKIKEEWENSHEDF